MGYRQSALSIVPCLVSLCVLFDAVIVVTAIDKTYVEISASGKLIRRAALNLNADPISLVNVSDHGAETILDETSRTARARELVTATPSGGLVSDARKIITADLAMRSLDVHGDFVETGVYNGGTTILMAKVLADMGPRGKKLWAADSFEGLPPEDAAGELHAIKETLGSVNEVIGDSASHIAAAREGNKGEYAVGRAVFDANLKANGLLNSTFLQVLQGWFNETLPRAHINAISFLRLDGDIYISTMEALDSLYDKLSPGGYIYVDDYGAYTGCKAAVDKYRHAHGITESMVPVYEDASESYEAVWWQKSTSASELYEDASDLYDIG